ncbi:hypothetical protein TNCV_957041 [Trichonephila clavipes]|nr:hypothetical protein TNCV_957041 [Trichonephila clavipes]
MAIGAYLRGAIELPRTSHTCSLRLRSEDISDPLIVEYPTIAGCKDNVPLPLTCQSTSIEHMKVGMFVCHDVCPDHQITSTIIVLYDNVRGWISTGFSPDKNASRVVVQTKS